MIPSTAFFIWFGGDLPWIHAFAMVSAARMGGFERVLLLHDSDLTRSPGWAELSALLQFEARPIDAASIFRAAGVPQLQAVYDQLKAPAARANVLRAAWLLAEGGVYLDLDTVTVRSFDGLRAHGDFFCGEEPLAYPVETMRSRNPARWAAALARDGARDICRRAPGGWRWFRHIEGAYTCAANNAVLGAPAGHPFVARLVEAMLEVPSERIGVRYELGTSLLQSELAHWRRSGGAEARVTVYPPPYFYPLGPEISEHWFRATRSLDVDAVLSPETHVVHWYASVRTAAAVPRTTPAWVEAHRDSELFSALAWRVMNAG